MSTTGTHRGRKNAKKMLTSPPNRSRIPTTLRRPLKKSVKIPMMAKSPPIAARFDDTFLANTPSEWAEFPISRRNPNISVPETITNLFFGSFPVSPCRFPHRRRPGRKGWHLMMVIQFLLGTVTLFISRITLKNTVGKNRKKSIQKQASDFPLQLFVPLLLRKRRHRRLILLPWISLGEGAPAFNGGHPSNHRVKLSIRLVCPGLVTFQWNWTR